MRITTSIKQNGIMNNSPEPNQDDEKYIKTQQSKPASLKSILKNLPPGLIIVEIIFIAILIYYFIIR